MRAACDVPNNRAVIKRCLISCLLCTMTCTICAIMALHTAQAAALVESAPVMTPSGSNIFLLTCLPSSVCNGTFHRTFWTVPLTVLKSVLICCCAGRLDAELLTVTKRVTNVLQMLPKDITPINLEELRRVKQQLVELESKAENIV